MSLPAIALTSANRISSSGMPLNLGIDREQDILRRAILDESHPTSNFRLPQQPRLVPRTSPRDRHTPLTLHRITPTLDPRRHPSAPSQVSRNAGGMYVSHRLIDDSLGLTSLSGAPRVWYHKKSRIPLLRAPRGGNTCSIV